MQKLKAGSAEHYEQAARESGYGTSTTVGKRKDATTIIGTHMHGYQISRFFGAGVLQRIHGAARAGKLSERTETERRRGIFTGEQILRSIMPSNDAQDGLSKDVENAKLTRARRLQLEGAVIPRADVENAIADAMRELQNALGHTTKVNNALRGLRDLFRE